MNIGFLSAKLTRSSDSHCYLVAYSGGIDSHVLLHLLVTLRKLLPKIQLRALHVNHGLNPNADDWTRHCQRVCEQLDVPFLYEKISVNNKGDGIEASARRERYRVLATHLKKNECLLTAHNQDDQAETVLLQLMRGAGPKGLSAMPLKKPFAHSLHLRPLLAISRDTILKYAQRNKLSWVKDDSNQNTRFDRNYLRHHIMPLLKQRWPAAINNLSRSALHCAQSAVLLTEMAEQDVIAVQGTQINTLSVSELLQLNEPRRANVLRYWVLQHDERPPGAQRLQQLQDDVLHCDTGANPIFVLEKLTLRRYRDDLYLVDPLPSVKDFEVQWDCQSTLKLPGDLGELHPEAFKGFDRLTVRFRRGGEVIKPAGSAYTQSLKKLFQQWGVPPWERDRIPLVFSDSRLVSVVGYTNNQCQPIT